MSGPEDKMTGVTTRPTPRRSLIGALAGLALLVALVPTSAPVSSVSPQVSLIIRAAPGAVEDLRDEVLLLGGSIGLDLHLIDAVSATLPASAVDALRSSPTVGSIHEDAPVALSARRSRDEPSVQPPMAALTTETLDVDRLWRRGITGDGVGVALIDSGVAPVEGVGEVYNGLDISFDGPSDDLRYLDAFGHGTHLAGIIAGADAAVPDRPSSRDAASRFVGVAPGAHIVNVKVADAAGAADVSQVIYAIQWVVEHQDDAEVPIHVLTLAFGTDGSQDYRIDPLTHAVEAAWHSGLVVVAAAGNDEIGAPLRNPARDPYVISVGAVDPGRSRSVRDDTVLSFSNCGNADRSVDVLAPGKSVSSLRVPNSQIDIQNPSARDGDRFFRGTGTSQAAAVVSGVVALMLDHRPDLAPDEVKALLTGTADDLRRAPSACRGAGVVDAPTAVSSRVPRNAEQTWDLADGTGSLEAARGTYHVAQDGEVLTGEIDVLGGTWSGGTWSGDTWSGGTWSGGTWSGGTWSGGTWSVSSWE